MARLLNRLPLRRIWGAWPVWLRICTTFVILGTPVLSHFLTCNLLPPRVILELDTEPSGGDIWLDGRLLGKGPLEVDVSSRFWRLDSFYEVQFGCPSARRDLGDLDFVLEAQAEEKGGCASNIRVAGWLAHSIRLQSSPEAGLAKCPYLRVEGPRWSRTCKFQIKIPVTPQILVGQQAGASLIAMLDHEDARLRVLAVRRLLELGQGKQAIPALSRWAKTGDPGTRAEAADLLGGTRDASAIPVLQGLLSDPDWAVRASAVKALGQMGDKSAVPQIRKLAEDPSSAVRKEVPRALEALGE